MILYVDIISRISKFIQTESRLIVFRAFGEREIRNDYMICTGFLLGVMKMF